MTPDPPTPEEMAVAEAARFPWLRTVEPRPVGVRALLLRECAGTAQSIDQFFEE